IHAHIQRAIIKKAEAAFGIVKLRRRHTQIEQHTAHLAFQAAASYLLAQLRKTALHNYKAAIFGRQCLPCGNGLRVFIEPQQPPVRTEMLQDQAAVSASSEGAVQVAAVRLYREGGNGFFEQNGDVAKGAGHNHKVRSSNSSGIPPGALIASRSSIEMEVQASSSHS